LNPIRKGSRKAAKSISRGCKPTESLQFKTKAAQRRQQCDIGAALECDA
jgi:hypothetical protein